MGILWDQPPPQPAQPQDGGILSNLAQLQGNGLGQGGDYSNLGPMLMALGAGIAGGSGKGWGPGIGAGLSGAENVMQKRLQLQQQRMLGLARLGPERYQVVRGPNGQQFIFDKLNPPQSGTVQMQQPFGGQQQAPAPQGAAPMPPQGAPTDQNAPMAGAVGGVPYSGAQFNVPGQNGDPGSQSVTANPNGIAPGFSPPAIGPGSTAIPASAIPAVPPQLPSLKDAANAPTAPNPMGMTNSGVAALTDYSTKAFQGAQDAEKAAQTQNFGFDTLTKALDSLPDKNDPSLMRRYLIPGPDEEARSDNAAKANLVASQLGAPLPFNEKDVANLQLAVKESKQLGIGATRAAFGASREGQQTIQTMLKIQPNQEQTPMGRRSVLAYRRALNDRDIDFGDFATQWMQSPQHPGDFTGAQAAFDQARPPQYYANKAQSEIDKYDADGTLAANSAQSQSMANARDAIAKGVPKNVVINKLVKAGINPSGL